MVHEVIRSQCREGAKQPTGTNDSEANDNSGPSAPLTIIRLKSSVKSTADSRQKGSDPEDAALSFAQEVGLVRGTDNSVCPDDPGKPPDYLRDIVRANWLYEEFIHMPIPHSDAEFLKDGVRKGADDRIEQANFGHADVFDLQNVFIEHLVASSFNLLLEVPAGAPKVVDVSEKADRGKNVS